MASSASSRHQVTITLGRSGQVVKRRAISDIGNDDEVPISRKKRSVRERLGCNVVDSDSYESQQRNKRQQIESNRSHGDDCSDRQVGEDDLRLKLMRRKGLLQRSNGGVEQNGVDLREKLSRNPKNLPRYDARGHAPESRARYVMRDKVPELRSTYSLREAIPGPSAVVSQIPSARSVDDLYGSSRKPYSFWTADGSRHRSPERLTSVRGDASSPGTYDQIRSVPPLRSVSTSRTQSLTTRDVPDTLRTQPYVGKSTISVDTVQRANGITQSSAALPTAAPVMTEVPLTVTGLLNSLGLEKYVVLFQAEEVDMAALRQMGESDLKDMGVPMKLAEAQPSLISRVKKEKVQPGFIESRLQLHWEEMKSRCTGPRKKILLAVGPQSK